MRRFLVDLRLIVGTVDIYRQFWPPNSALYMGIITHLGRRAGRLRHVWRDVRRFVIPLWAVFDPGNSSSMRTLDALGDLLKFAAPGIVAANLVRG